MLLDGGHADHQRLCDASVRLPSAIAAMTSSSLGLSSAMRLRFRRRPSIRATTSGSIALPPSATRAAASANSSTLPTRSLSRYPMPSAPSARLRGVALLVVLGEDQHAGLGPLSTHLDRRHQAVVAVAGRHVDVGHEQVRPVGQPLAKEIVGVAGPSHHLEPGHGQYSRDALAKEDVVLADHDAPRRSHRRERIAVRRRRLLAASHVVSGTRARSALDERLRRRAGLRW